MRANVAEYDLIAPATLVDALAVLAKAEHTPIAGGTELMVALAAGRLPTKPLLSINHLAELRFIEVTAATITIGSGTTFTDLRRHPVITSDLTLLSQAASWTGSIANQNRGTLGGNIVNASPAADSPPALLVYDAELTLISAAGTRTLRYNEFHLSYKKTALRPGELLLSITLQRSFKRYIGYIRKVGTRNAQAISKVALAGLARMNHGIVEDIHLAAASLREVPARLSATEQVIIGKPVDGATIISARAACKMLLAPTSPCSSSRSLKLAAGKYAGTPRRPA